MLINDDDTTNKRTQVPQSDHYEIGRQREIESARGISSLPLQDGNCDPMRRGGKTSQESILKQEEEKKMSPLFYHLKNLKVGHCASLPTRLYSKRRKKRLGHGNSHRGHKMPSSIRKGSVWGRRMCAGATVPGCV